MVEQPTKCECVKAAADLVAGFESMEAGYKKRELPSVGLALLVENSLDALKRCELRVEAVRAWVKEAHEESVAERFEEANSRVARAENEFFKEVDNCVRREQLIMIRHE